MDLCLKDPGREIDLYVRADLAAFAKVWLGELRWEDAVSTGTIKLTGSRHLVSGFPGWLLLSHFASHGSARVAAHH